MTTITCKEQEYASYGFKILPLSEEDGGGFLVYFPDLIGCMSDGETIEKAVTNGYDAAMCWIEANREWGKKIPKPSFKLKNKAMPDMSGSEEEKTRKVEEALNECWGF